MAIMGSSGSGKSTLLNILGMLDELDEGSYDLDGVPIKNLNETKAANYRNKFLGFVFQSFNLINYKSAMENVALWHERDISHSSVERMFAPDATVTLDFALNRLINVVENLMVYPQNMQKNIEQMGGLHCSQRVLLALIEEAKISREDSYKIVQTNAMKVWEEGEDFKTLLKSDPLVSSKLSDDKIDSLFNDSHHLKSVDKIFSKVFS